MSGSDLKALVLAGGKGTRLRPITHTSAKQLVPVANKPILFYGLEAICAAGIRDVGMIVGETRPEIEKAVGDGRAFGLKVTYLDQAEPLGLAHAVRVAELYLKKTPFVMYLGDNLIKDGIRPFVDQFRRDRPHAQILLAHVPHPEQFGVAELKNGRVVRLVEKPKRPKSDLALVGVYMFDHHIFESVKRIRPSRRNEYEITDAIQDLVEHGRTVRPHIIRGWWKDTGRLEDLLEANRLILETQPRRLEGSVDRRSRIEGGVGIAKGAKIINSVIRGPAVIGERTVVRDAYVGPFTAVYHDVVLERCEVEHSIVLEHSRVTDVRRIVDSLIGQRVEVTRSEARPHAYRLMVGDSSRVEVIG